MVPTVENDPCSSTTGRNADRQPGTFTPARSTGGSATDVVEAGEELVGVGGDGGVGAAELGGDGWPVGSLAGGGVAAGDGVLGGGTERTGEEDSGADSACTADDSSADGEAAAAVVAAAVITTDIVASALVATAIVGDAVVGTAVGDEQAAVTAIVSAQPADRHRRPFIDTPAWFHGKPQPGTMER